MSDCEKNSYQLLYGIAGQNKTFTRKDIDLISISVEKQAKINFDNTTFEISITAICNLEEYLSLVEDFYKDTDIVLFAYNPEKSISLIETQKKQAKLQKSNPTLTPPFLYVAMSRNSHLIGPNNINGQHFYYNCGDATNYNLALQNMIVKIVLSEKQNLNNVKKALS